MQNALRDLIRTGEVRSAHDCSEGGLAVALAESCFNPAGSLGAQIDLSAAGQERLDQILFNETQSRIVISTVPENAEKVLHFLQNRNLPRIVSGPWAAMRLRSRLPGKRCAGPSQKSTTIGMTRSPTLCTTR